MGVGSDFETFMWTNVYLGKIRNYHFRGALFRSINIGNGFIQSIARANTPGVRAVIHEQMFCMMKQILRIEFRIASTYDQSLQPDSLKIRDLVQFLRSAGLVASCKAPEKRPLHRARLRHRFVCRIPRVVRSFEAAELKPRPSKTTRAPQKYPLNFPISLRMVMGPSACVCMRLGRQKARAGRPE